MFAVYEDIGETHIGIPGLPRGDEKLREADTYPTRLSHRNGDGYEVPKDGQGNASGIPLSIEGRIPNPHRRNSQSSGNLAFVSVTTRATKEREKQQFQMTNLKDMNYPTCQNQTNPLLSP